MRNPFRRSRYVEKLDGQLLTQWMSIIELEKVIFAAGVKRYDKVEIVILSQWATFMGFALSKANDDPTQRQECGDRLRKEIDQLFVGLNNGVAVADQVVVPRCWIAANGDATVPYAAFRQKWDGRLKQYTQLLMPQRSSEEDTMWKVICEAIGNIMPDIMTTGHNDSLQFSLVRDGLYRFVALELERIKKMIDE